MCTGLLAEYQIQRSSPGSSTPSDTFTDDASPCRSPSSLTLLEGLPLGDPGVSADGWVSVPGEIDVDRTLTALSCAPRAPG